MQPTITAERPPDSASHFEPTVEVAREILRCAFAGVTVPIALVLQDGTMLYQSEEPAKTSIVFRSVGVLKLLFRRASDLSAGQAVVRGDIAVKGDVEQALAAIDAVATARSSGEWIHIMALAARLPRVPIDVSPAGRAPAKLHGRPHSMQRDRAAIAYHYDVSNDFYGFWLDENMIYSCAYFRHEGDTIDEAQRQKCDLICRKLQLAPGERLLDIGCGWGGLIRFATREYGVQAIGVTLSRQQAEYARARILREGLDKRCDVELLDYRELDRLGKFDKVSSIGMVEHVGDAMMPTYFTSAYQALAPGGLFLNHGIISQYPRSKGVRALTERFFPNRSRFTEAYVFPDGEMPRLPQMTSAAEDSGFEVRDVENLREHYTLTLRQWLRRLEAHEDVARALVGDATFNVWRLWLAGSARHFELGHLGVVQMLLAKPSPGQRPGLPTLREDLYRG